MADKKISQLTAATTPLAGTEVLPIVQGGSTVKVAVSDLTAGRSVSASGLTTTGGANLATSSGSVGIGTGFPVQKLHVSTAGNNYIASHNSAGSTSALLLGAESGQTVLYSWTTVSGATGVPLAFYTGATEHSRLETAGNYLLQNGNVKIGTAGKGIDFSANTGAAGETSSLLDWYEEGTWTVTVTPGTSGTITLVGGQDISTYTRIGRCVMCTVGVRVSGVSSPIGTYVDINIPFTSTAGTGLSGVPAITTPLGTAVIQSSSTILRVYKDASTISGGDYIQLEFFYFA